MPELQISVVVPVFNEEENLPELYRRLKPVLAGIGSHEMVFVNDGSHDRSLEILHQLAATDPQVRFIDFSRNFGHQAAIQAGIDHARGQSVAILDADLQDPPEFIADLHRKLSDGHDVVYARRRSRADHSLLKKAAYKIFYRLLARLSQIDIPLDTGDFRIMDRRVVKVLRAMPERNKFLRGQIAWIGFRQTSLEYDRKARTRGEPGYTWSKLVRLALDGLTGFSIAPLRLASLCGFSAFFISLAVMLYALVAHFTAGASVPRGWTSLMIAILFLGSIQLLSVGIMGEYLSGLLSDVRRRPLYVIRETETAHPET